MSRIVNPFALVLLSFVLAGSAAPAGVQAAEKKGKDSAQKLSEAEKKFITQNYEGSLHEIALGELAAQKAADPEVKQFAQKLVQDHTQANTGLRDIAAEYDLPLAVGPNRAHRKDAEKLSAETGGDFDLQFVTAMEQSHAKSTRELSRQAATAKNPDLKQWATQTLPVITDHLATVTLLRKRLTGATTLLR